MGKNKSDIERDAERYRFLRSESSRGHRLETRRCLSVSVNDWARNFGPTLTNFWASSEVTLKDMDDAVDEVMKKAAEKLRGK